MVPGAARLERRELVQFSAREIVMSKLARVRSMASHRLPANAPLEEVIEFLADYFTEREDPAARHARREERTERKGKPAMKAKVLDPQQPSRYVPAHVRDEVFVRDKNRCTYVAPNGTQCGSTHVLQVDHIHPVARGGGGAVDNLRLLCAQHNRLEAERLMGRCGPPERAR
jgi:5-methylcytosine-specific restriction endonuclease McrA